MNVAGFGIPIGLNDKYGRPVHIGDTLEFDRAEWGGGDNRFTITIERGELTILGCPSDIEEYCSIVIPYDKQVM